jgi:hypothetical protein
VSGWGHARGIRCAVRIWDAKSGALQERELGPVNNSDFSRREATVIWDAETGMCSSTVGDRPAFPKTFSTSAFRISVSAFLIIFIPNANMVFGCC